MATAYDSGLVRNAMNVSGQTGVIVIYVTLAVAVPLKGRYTLVSGTGTESCAGGVGS